MLVVAFCPFLGIPECAISIAAAVYARRPVVNDRRYSRMRKGSSRTLENHVIPAKAGIHCVPDEQWTPAYAGVTTYVIFTAWGESKTHDLLV
jgi:hypothetical protein